MHLGIKEMQDFTQDFGVLSLVEASTNFMKAIKNLVFANTHGRTNEN